MRYHSHLLTLTVLLAALLGLQACSHGEPPLRIGTNPWPGYLGLYYARDLGLLDERDIRLVQFDTTEDVLSAFRNHAIDAAAVTLDEALLLAENKQAPRIVLVFDTSNGADVVVTRPEIKELAQLRQRRIGVETNALGAYMLSRLLVAAKLQPDEVEIVHLPLQQHVQAYQSGQVDAVITFDPPRSQLLAAGARPIFSSADIPGEIVDVLVVREETLIEHKHHVGQLITNYFTALDKLQQDPEHAARMLAAAMPLSHEELLTAWQLMRLTDQASNRAMLAPNGALQTTMQRMAQTMVEQKLLDRVPSITPLLHGQLVEHHTR